MNSDSDSDWDCTSEEPHITHNNAINHHNPEDNNKINSQQHLATHSKTQKKQSENNEREKANLKVISTLNES